MTTGDVLAGVSWAEEADHEWVHLLLGDWQLLADLSFADLALWVPASCGWQAAAQVRPTTGVSLFEEDVVGRAPAEDLLAAISRVSARGLQVHIAREPAQPTEPDGLPAEAISVDVVPVRREGRVIAVLSRHVRAGNVRRRGRLESRYVAMAADLLTMVAEGTFPNGGGGSTGRGGAPRVGDGVIQLDDAGLVTYASPNAVSALRRLGVEHNIPGWRLGALLERGGPEPLEGREEASAVLAGRAPWHTELRLGSATVTVRAVPLVQGGRHTGAALLLRDVTELRRRDRELMTKDATIREIHHRVKNNLQTVAALLRLQGRRLPDEEAQRALADAGRRVAVIAGVHESLSAGFDDTVEFDEIATRGLASGVEVARTSDAEVEARLEGHFGVLLSEDAMSVALVLGELVQNAVEHGLTGRSGSVTVTAVREGDDLSVSVADDGVGVPEGVTPGARQRSAGGGLGTQIVETFVQDLHGTITWAPRPGGGTVAHFTARLGRHDRAR